MRTHLLTDQSQVLGTGALRLTRATTLDHPEMWRGAPRAADAYGGATACTRDRWIGALRRRAHLVPKPKDGPVDPAYPDRPTPHKPLKHYEWWVSEILARGSAISAADMATLRDKRFRAVVNLQKESNVDEARARALGLNYLHIPLKDNTAPTQAQMIDFLNFVTDPANQPAYVHCRAGVGRTGVAVAVYRMAVEGMPVEDALKEARSFRLVVPAQVAFIRQFGADLAAGHIPGYPLPRRQLGEAA